MGNEDNFGIKIKFISLLTKFFTFYFGKNKPKNMQFISYLKNQFRYMS